MEKIVKNRHQLETNFSVATLISNWVENCKEKVSQKKKKKKNCKEKGNKELIKRERETKEIFNEERDNVETIN